VCKLRHSLYGFKQSPRSWYARIDTDIHRRGLKRTSANPNVYYHRHGKSIILLILYVDDLFITSSDSEGIISLKIALSNEFEMKDFGLMKKFLGIEVTQVHHGILFHQTSYVQNILQEYFDRASHYTSFSELLQLRKNTGISFTDEKEYQSLVGKSHYLTKTHPELGFSASLVSCCMQKSQLMHRKAV
jgi:hypothetical protein